MLRLLAALLACLVLFAGAPGHADPSDIDAASRGVVRVIIVQKEGEQLVPVSHGTGFAVSPERVVTNSHVVEQVQQDQTLYVGIVPSDGGEAVFGRIVGGMDVVKRILAMPTNPGGEGAMKGQILTRPVTILKAQRLDGTPHPTGRAKVWLLFQGR